MSSSIPRRDFLTVFKVFVLGTLIGPVVGFLVFFFGASFSLFINSPTQFLSDVTDFKLLFAIFGLFFVFGLLPSMFSSMVCSAYLYFKGKPSIWLAIAASFPLLIGWFLYMSSTMFNPHTSKVAASAFVVAFAFLTAAITWAVVNKLMFGRAEE